MLTKSRWVPKNLEGWGRYRKAQTHVSSPASVEEVAAILAGTTEPIIQFGQGRSYGDAALNAAGRSLLFDRFNQIIEFDANSGLIVCEPGVTLAGILARAVPDGWFLPVTPGTRFASIAGCLAADVHGKNHHIAGSVSRHIPWFEIVVADGTQLRCSEGENNRLFEATAGGMGLTGVITKVALQLSRIESTWIKSESITTESLRETMDELTANDQTWPYTVAWVDCTATGSEMGRGEVILGRHATLDELSDEQQSNSMEFPPQPRLSLPFVPPFSLVNRTTTRLFNEIYYRKGFGKKRRSTISSAFSYFYPLDIANSWNRLYGPAGFVQYQFVVPMECGYDVIAEVLSRSIESGHEASLSVLKRFGKQQQMLSFPKPGWTLALDIAIRPGLFRLLAGFDQLIARNNGRVYLAKDASIDADSFRMMYPEYGQWLEVKKSVDPTCRFSSNLSRRLEIDDDVLGTTDVTKKEQKTVKKRWLIVGATGGIGSAVAKELARKGNDLVLLDLPESAGKLDELAAEVKKINPLNVHTYPFTESSPEDYDMLLDRIEVEAGGIYGFLWAAGVMWQQSDLQLDAGLAAKQHQINYTVQMQFLERVAHRLDRRGSGHIAAIGSPAGDRGRRSNYLYGADKAALHAYLQGLAHRLAGREIIVTTIKPGPTKTPMTAGMEKLPLLAEPEDQAKRIVEGLESGCREIYTPGIWKWIMKVIKMMPDFVFNKLDL